MWYSSYMPENMTPHIQRGKAAVRFAQDVREYHRRRSPTYSAQREADLAEARLRLKNAMTPLRSYLGRIEFLPSKTRIRERERIEALSKEMQAERRKIWKMQQATKRQRRRASAAERGQEAAA